MHSPVHISRNDPLGRFLAVPASLLGTVLSLCAGHRAPYTAVRAGVRRVSLRPGRGAASWSGSPQPMGPLWGLVAVSLFWLPIEFAMLPALPVPPPDGYDVSRGVGIVAAFYLFLVAWPLAGIGCTLALDGRDFRVAGVAWAAYAAVALPLGLLTGFLTWHPAGDVAGLLATPVLIYTLTAVPEEFLFRGVIQNLLTHWWGPRIGSGSQPAFLGWRTSPIFAMCSSPRWPGSGMGGCMPGPARLPRRP